MIHNPVIRNSNLTKCFLAPRTCRRLLVGERSCSLEFSGPNNRPFTGTLCEVKSYNGARIVIFVQMFHTECAFCSREWISIYLPTPTYSHRALNPTTCILEAIINLKQIVFMDDPTQKLVEEFIYSRRQWRKTGVDRRKSVCVIRTVCWNFLYHRLHSASAGSLWL